MSRQTKAVARPTARVSLAQGLAEAWRDARVSVDKDDLPLSASDEVTPDPRRHSPARIQPAADSGIFSDLPRIRSDTTNASRRSEVRPNRRTA
jgi:hypothetical protein